MKQRSNVISYVTVNDSPDSDSSLNSPYAIDTLASLESTGGALELPTREAADSSSSRNIIVPPLKTQLSDCVVATQVSGRFLPWLSCCIIPATFVLEVLEYLRWVFSSFRFHSCCSESASLGLFSVSLIDFPFTYVWLFTFRNICKYS